MSDPVSLSTVRRRAARLGLKVSKVPERSRDFAQYGPYCLIDAGTTGLIAYRLDFAELVDAVNSRSAG